MRTASSPIAAARRAQFSDSTNLAPRSAGPVVKNKVFWFFNWESLRQRTPFTYRITVPTELQRQGDFSQTFDRNGAPFQIADPSDHAPNALRRPDARTLFPGQPHSRQPDQPDRRASAVTVSAAEHVPGDPLTGANNYFSVVPAPYDGDNFSVRIDPEYPTSTGCSAGGRTTTDFPERRRYGISAAVSARSKATIARRPLSD